VAWPAICFAAALSFQPAHPQPIPVLRSTIEPTLPLAIDLRVASADPARGEPALLRVTLNAATDLSEVALSLAFPAGLQAEGGPPAAIPSPGRIRTGEARIYSLRLVPLKAGDMPITIEASFRLPDGRLFRTQQGTLWRRAPGPEARHNAGAYEVMGVPVAASEP